MTRADIRADYALLQHIAQTFSAEAEANRLMLLSLQWTQELLQDGDWEGAGATLFYAEMQAEVLPSLQRLVEALEAAAQTTWQMVAVLRQAEADAAAVLRARGRGGRPQQPVESFSPWAFWMEGGMGHEPTMRNPCQGLDALAAELWVHTALAQPANLGLFLETQ